MGWDESIIASGQPGFTPRMHLLFETSPSLSPPPPPCPPLPAPVQPAGVSGAGNVESAVRGLCVAIVGRCAALFKVPCSPIPPLSSLYNCAALPCSRCLIALSRSYLAYITALRCPVQGAL